MQYFKTHGNARSSPCKHIKAHSTSTEKSVNFGSGSHDPRLSGMDGDRSPRQLTSQNFCSGDQLQRARSCSVGKPC